MKKIFLQIILLLIAQQFLLAQQPDYRVVFDMSVRDSISQQAVIRELALITEENADAKMEVVIYGHALSMALKNKSTLADGIREALKNKNVSFKVCAITMKRNNVTEADLLPGIQVVPDGIYEMVSKQHEGWGYVKVVH